LITITRVFREILTVKIINLTRITAKLKPSLILLANKIRKIISKEEEMPCLMTLKMPGTVVQLILVKKA